MYHLITDKSVLDTSANIETEVEEDKDVPDIAHVWTEPEIKIEIKEEPFNNTETDPLKQENNDYKDDQRSVDNKNHKDELSGDEVTSVECKVNQNFERIQQGSYGKATSVTKSKSIAIAAVGSFNLKKTLDNSNSGCADPLKTQNGCSTFHEKNLPSAKEPSEKEESNRKVDGVLVLDGIEEGIDSDLEVGSSKGQYIDEVIILSCAQLSCILCGKQLKNERTCKRHIKLVHKDSCSLKCPLCPRILKHEKSLKIHMRRHIRSSHI